MATTECFLCMTAYPDSHQSEYIRRIELKKNLFQRNNTSSSNQVKSSKASSQGFLPYPAKLALITKRERKNLNRKNSTERNSHLITTTSTTFAFRQASKSERQSNYRNHGRRIREYLLNHSHLHIPNDRQMLMDLPQTGRRGGCRNQEEESLPKVLLPRNRPRSVRCPPYIHTHTSLEEFKGEQIS
jgi:hypothetical protein